MEENLDDLNSELAGITKSCYKYNRTTNNRMESCDTLINKENSCFAIWEFNDIDRIIGKRPLNLTEISESSKLSLKGKPFRMNFPVLSLHFPATSVLTISPLQKGCFSGQHPSNDHCSFKSKPKQTLICYCKNSNCNQKDLPNTELLERVKFPDPPNTGPSLPSPQDQQSLNPAYLLGALFSIAIFLVLVYKFVYRRNNFNKQLTAHDLPTNDAKSYDNKPNSSDLSLPEHKEPLLAHQLRPQIIECLKKGEFCSVGGRLAPGFSPSDFAA